MTTTPNLFVRSLLTDVILMEPRELGSNYADLVLAKLNSTMSGRCSRYGFIEPNSISVHRIVQAEVAASALNGSVHFTVQYYANVCNPPVGGVISARAVNRNKFGIQAHSGILYSNGDFLPVVQSIVTTTAITKVSEVDVSTIEVGDEFFVEILSKQFQLDSPRIMVIGRIVIDPGSSSTALQSRVPVLASPLAGFASTSILNDNEDDTMNDEDAGEDETDAEEDDEDDPGEDEAANDDESVDSDNSATDIGDGDAVEDVDAVDGDDINDDDMDQDENDDEYF